MNRTTFIVDGFNLYHSVCDASRALGLAGTGVKWLNLRKSCESYLALIGGPAQPERIYYFSALATHLESAKPDLTLRHRTYLECLEDTGVVVELSRFKMKDIVCRQCGYKFQRAEEKETDVALAVTLLEILHRDECDTAVLITGDTDIAPAVRTASALFPLKRVCFAFPFGRKNKELAKLVSTSFRISKEAYASHQFADPVILKSGKVISKPAKW
ncbi:MAG TPA: NYN domain-containing protein [Thermoanaerobaculia bacterium]|nr:NYN domain-containing protein [Thermoanaerobaculia bacterium]